MLRVVAHQFGPPSEVLRYEPTDKPVPGRGDALVRMLASAINPSDLIPVTGAYRHRTSLPFVPGYDGVGVVAEVGIDADPSLIGRRVLPLGSPGNWSTWKVMPAEWCVDVPDAISNEQAAMSYINPLTAKLMIQALAPAPGDRIGITAGASTIGRMLIRLIRSIGASPLAIVRSEWSQLVLRDEAVETVLEGANLPSLDAGIDAVGGVAAQRLAEAIKPGGVLLHYGLLSGQPLTGSLLASAKASVKLFRLRDWVHSSRRSDLRAAMHDTFADIQAGMLSSPVAAVYPLPAIQDALFHNASPNRRGKILLRV